MKEYKLKPQVEYYLTSDRKTIRAEFDPEELSVRSNKTGLFVKNIRPDDITITLEDHITIFEQINADESNNEHTTEKFNPFSIKFTYPHYDKNKKEIVLYAPEKDIAKVLYNNLQIIPVYVRLVYDENLLDRYAITTIPLSAFNEGHVFKYELYYNHEAIFSIKLYGSHNKSNDMDNLLKMPENKGWTFIKTVYTE